MEGITGGVSKTEVLDSDDERHATEDKDIRYHGDAEASNAHRLERGSNVGTAGVRTRLQKIRDTT